VLAGDLPILLNAVSLAKSGAAVLMQGGVCDCWMFSVLAAFLAVVWGEEVPSRGILCRPLQQA